MSDDVASAVPLALLVLAGVFLALLVVRALVEARRPRVTRWRQGRMDEPR